MKSSIKAYLTVFSASLTILAFEIIFIRILAIKEWQNYTSMIISLALLGFGTSGTIITFLKKQIEKKLNLFNLIFKTIYFFSIMICFILYCLIPFNPFAILWDLKQLLFLFLHFIVLLLFFTAGSILIGIHFLSKQKISNLYFFNLLGSGIGTLLALILLNFFHPNNSLIIIIYIISITTIILLLLDLNKKNMKTFLMISFILILLPILFIIILKNSNLLKTSEYKGISYRLKMPNAKITAEKYSPLGLVQVIEADGLREVNGLSYNFKGKIPIQKGILFDGDSMSPITPFRNNLKEVEFVKHTSSALPFYLFGKNKINEVLIIGTGGGEGILRALSFQTQNITGIEINKNVINTMKNELATFSGNIYNYKNVNIINKDAREYSRKTKNKFDIIELSLLDSFNAASSGVYSLNENYIYTIESFNELYKILSENGILAITRWIKEPPRDNLKLFNTIITMMKQSNIKNFEKKIVFIRSANTATLCISKKNFDTNLIRNFCNKNSFDLIYTYDISKKQTNKYFKIKNPIFYDACQKILSNESKQFLKHYTFLIKHSTDNSPYYFNFFKLKTLKTILKTKTRQIPFTEWGYVILIMLLIPTTLISFILILLPLYFIKKKNKIKSYNSLSLYTFFFFFIIGIAFFFIEMPLIQKFALFLSHPVYSLSITISSILIFSGIGSLLSKKIIGKFKIYIFMMIFIIIILYILSLDYIFNLFISINFIYKITISIMLISIPGFFMGIPFPLALTIIKNKNDYLIPWAWGINGFASVISSLLAAIFAILFGFKNVLLIAGLLYLLAGFFYWKIRNISNNNK